MSASMALTDGAAGDGCRVSGGAGGIAVALDELEQLGAAMSVLAGRLAAASGEVATVAVSPGLLASFVVAPDSAARAEGAVVLAAADLARVSARMTELGARVRLSALLYRQAETAAREAVRRAQDAVGFGVGVSLGRGWALIPVALAAGWAGRQVAGYDGPGSLLIRRVTGAVSRTAGDVLAAQPWLMAGAAGAVDGMVAGLAASSVAGSPLGLATVAAVGPEAFGGSQQVMLRGLLRRAPYAGYLDDGAGGRAVPLAQPVTVAVRPEAPQGIEDLAVSMDEVGGMSTVPRQAQRDPWRSRVRVTRVPQAGGGDAWVVVIPGTQTWPATGGTNPSDLTSNLALMAQVDTALVQATTDAMTQAGVQPGDPVLVAGHSQGGIAAAAMAADPDSPFTITHVYTEGSPIAGFAFHDSVSVLAVEHSGDLVANLDDGPGVNPDTPTWTTVTAPVPTTSHEPGRLPAPIAAHESRPYQVTAAALDRSEHPSIVAWRGSAAPFFTGRGEVGDYRMDRVPAE